MSMPLQVRTAMATRVLLGATGVCLGLAALLWLFAGSSGQDGAVEPIEVTIPDATGIAQGAGGNYPMMLDQPLFWPERVPAPAAETEQGGAGGAAAGPEGLVYLGVIVKGDERQALLKDGESVHVLREGETIRDLAVRHIGAEGVTLASATAEVRLPAPVEPTESIEFRRLE